ncbi:MAG: terpene synthase family protein [Gammaproteobacteria bacterium]
MNQEDFVIPQLYCPFRPEVNPHVETVEEHTLAWARRFSLAKDESGYERLRKTKPAKLAARTYTSASLDELAIGSDWNTWLFSIDDECDETGIGKRPERLKALHAQCLEVLSGQAPEHVSNRSRPRPGRPDVPLILALDELRGRMQNLMPRAWMDRFAVSVSEYFEASVWESENRERGAWPDSVTYSRMRPYTGAVYTVINLIDMTEAHTLPLVVREHPCYRRLMLITCNVVCWCNDLISLRKERAHGDIHNLALILQHEGHITLQAAVDRAARLIEREVKDFMVLQNDLPSFGPEVDGIVRRFVVGMGAWIRGNLDWSYESGRYQVAAEERIAVPVA